jgi:hypothetical protein
MADAAYKLSLFYVHNAERDAGWSENWYTSVSDLTTIEGNPNEWQSGLAGKLALASMRLHGRTAFVKYVRIAELAAPRRTRVVNTRLQYNPQVPGTETWETDQTTSGLNLRVFAGNGVNSDHQLRGIPDGMIGQNGRFRPTDDYFGRLGEFHLFRAQNNIVVRFKDESQQKKPIEAITQTGIVTITNHGYNTNDLVRVGLLRGLEVFNGVWRINRIDANQFQLRFAVATTDVLRNSPSSYAQKLGFDSIGPDSWEITFATSHKVGKPTRVRVGRRTARRT